MFDIAPEHIHPLLVHFPVALWPLAVLFFLLSFFPMFEKLRLSSILLGLIASGIGYFALEFGETAADIVGELICDQALLMEHNDQAHTAWIIMTTTWCAALFFEIILKKVFKMVSLPAWPSIILLIGSILGTVFLVGAAHKGFQLTYYEAAAVQGVQKVCP